MIIGLTGLAGSGKDTVAALLAMKGFTRYAFADELRREVARTLDIAQGIAKFVATADDLWDTGLALRAYGKEVSDAIHLRMLSSEMTYAKPTPPLIRELLQRHGTEFRRTQDPNYWVGLLMSHISAARLAYINACTDCKVPVRMEKVIISDVRFPNEAEAIRDRGGKIWRVIRPGVKPVNDHSSESGQAEIVADVELVNDGTVYELALKVRDIL